MEDTSKQFCLWIPAEIYRNPAMTHLDRFLFGLLHSLCKSEGGTCTATNAELAHDLNVKPDTIQRSLKRLLEEEYITKNYIINDSGVVTKRALKIDDNFKALYAMYLNDEPQEPLPEYKRRT
jgi:DNA-binding Lrp family transcriptional regulator